MQAFCRSLQSELRCCNIDVQVVTPQPVFGRIFKTTYKFHKWIGYIDRYILFPWKLHRAASEADVVHICDHGNAMYSCMVGDTPVMVTCHDMLAVRGARGEDCGCPASITGRFLQRWICCGLEHAECVACVSKTTYQDACSILHSVKNLRVILNGLHTPYRRITYAESKRRLSPWPMPHGSYVLHVGSNQIRKNREAVLRVFAKIALGTDLYVVFAGEALSQELLALGNLLGINDRMIQITNPSDLELEALYSSAAAFLFPSRFEGFGWPLIEAQACGCPVVASDIAPFREVLMNSALLFPIDRENDMAAGLLRLIVDKEFWHEIQQRGYENVKTRFTTSRMIDDYLALYKEIACRN